MTMPDLSAFLPAARIVRANGLDFEVFEAGDGDRLALLLHGFPEHAISWRHQIPMLADMGFRVWAVNQRGYGNSAAPPSGHYGLGALLDDIAGLIDASGASSTVLVAHDWGALVAWTFAIRRVRPLDKLVVLNVPHPLCLKAALRNTWRQRAKSWYAAFFQMPILPEWFLTRRDGWAAAALIRDSAAVPDNFPRAVRAVYAANAARPGGMTAMLNWYREAARDLWRAGDLDQAIKVPTLAIWGEKDVALDLVCLEGTDRYVSDLRIERLPDASHWVQGDAPEAVNRLLAEFLKPRRLPSTPRVPAP